MGPRFEQAPTGLEVGLAEALAALLALAFDREALFAFEAFGPAGADGLGEGGDREDHGHSQDEGAGGRGGEAGVAAAPAAGSFDRSDGAGADGVAGEEPVEFIGQFAGGGKPAVGSLVEALETKGLRLRGRWGASSRGANGSVSSTCRSVAGTEAARNGGRPVSVW